MVVWLINDDVGIKYRSVHAHAACLVKIPQGRLTFLSAIWFIPTHSATLGALIRLAFDNMATTQECELGTRQRLHAAKTSKRLLDPTA